MPGLGGAIGNLPPHKRRSTLAQYVVRSEGNVQRLAFLLGYHRCHVYRLLYAYNMWPVVNAARKKRHLTKH